MALRAGGVAGLFKVIAGDDVAFRNVEMMVGEGRCLISAQTVVGRAGVLAGDVSDALAAAIDEMTGGHLADHDVVGADEVRGEVREVAVEEKVGRALVAQLVEVLEAGLAGSDEENIDSAAEQRANLLPLDLGVFFGGGEDEGAVARTEDAAE